MSATEGGKGFKAGIDLEPVGDFVPGVASGDERSPGMVTGRGDGGSLECPATPVGPVSDIQAAVDAARAAQVPVVSDPSFVEDIFQGPRQNTIVTDWYRWDGELGQIRVEVSCPGAAPRRVWAALRAGPDGSIVVQLTAADLLPGIHAEVIRHLPTPLPRIGPADENPRGWTYVNNPTFFWVDAVAGQWASVSGTVSAAGLSVTVVAEPVSLVVDPGDGTVAFSCAGPGVPVTRSNFHPNIQGCGYTYRDSSAVAPNGESFPVTVSISWHVTWSASSGEGGDLGFVSTTSDVRDLRVAEVQSVIVDQHP